MREIQKTKSYSKIIGKLPKGCQYCVRGEKLVMFVTGLCGQKCYFCPLSEEKKFQDVTYANERPIHREDKKFEAEEIFKEAELCDAKGAGFTGGDPLVTIERTCHYIKILKAKFGSKFHTHLYTPFKQVDEEKLQKLYDAGLDEIRFHPDMDDDSEWNKLDLAAKFDWDLGIEIPVLPQKKEETKKLIEFAKDKIQFLNLNELEMSETNIEDMSELGYETKDEFSYGVSESEEFAEELLEHCKQFEFNVHYCTTTLKDKVQLAKRIEKRAKNVAREFDKVSNEGMLIRGAVYSDKLIPGQDYRNKIKVIKEDKSKVDEIMNELKEIKAEIQKRVSIPEKYLTIDEDKLRILTRAAMMKNISRKIKNKCAIVEEYPTYDLFEVEIDFLN